MLLLSQRLVKYARINERGREGRWEGGGRVVVVVVVVVLERWKVRSCLDFAVQSWPGLIATNLTQTFLFPSEADYSEPTITRASYIIFYLLASGLPSGLPSGLEAKYNKQYGN